MAFNGWQATVQDDAGNALPLAEITVRIGGPSGSLATIYSDSTGTAKSNPFFATADGLAQFFAAPGVYYLVGALDGQTTDGWYVTLSNALTSGFATRAAMVAAMGWPWEVGAVVSDGTVQYEYIGTGTAISDMPGWVPFGSIYPEHWAKCGWLQGEVQPNADDAIPMKTALDYATALRVPLKLFGGKNYRLRSTLVSNSSFTTIESDSYRNALLYTDAGIGVGIDVFPVNPDLSATANITNIRFKGLTLYPRTAQLADIGIRIRRVTGCYTEGLILGGYFNAFKEMCCQNVHHERILGSAFNLDPAVTGAAWYYRTGILLDGTTWDGGYTTRFNWIVVGGDAYDALVQVGDSDVMQYNHGYFGASKRHILLKPDYVTAPVGGQSFSQIYFDGVGNPNSCDCVVVDGNGYPLARFSRVTFSLCVFGQANRGFVANNSADIRFVSFSNCTLQNMDECAIDTDATVQGKFDLNISGGFLNRWGLYADGDANKQFGGYIRKARSVTINGVTVDADGSSRIPFRFEGVDTLVYTGNNHITTGTMYTQSSVTSQIAANNIGTGVFAEDTVNNSSGVSPNPILKFGGTSIADLGGTYSTRSVNWYREGNMITVNGNITVSAKGTATGVASITLPVAPFASQGVVMGFIRPTNMTADAAVPAYVLYIPSGGMELFIRKYGTTGAPGANELSDTAFTNTTSINFSITYRVA